MNLFFIYKASWPWNCFDIGSDWKKINQVLWQVCVSAKYTGSSNLTAYGRRQKSQVLVEIKGNFALKPQLQTRFDVDLLISMTLTLWPLNYFQMTKQITQFLRPPAGDALNK